MYNGDVGGVSGGNNAQWNKKLADQLDAADGKKDGKISASVWNGFIKHTGSSGNKIKWSITVDNASKSFSYYDAKKDAGKVDWDNWEDMYATFSKGKTDAGKPEQTAAPGGTSAAASTSGTETLTSPAAASTSAGAKPAEVSPQDDFERVIQNAKFTNSIPTADDLKSGGFGLKEYPVQTLASGQTITVGKKDENGLNYIMDMNGGRTYENANGERVRISDFDAQFVAPGGTAVQYSDGKGSSSEVIYDKDGKPVQGRLAVKQDDGSIVTYEYKYENGKPVLQSNESAKPDKFKEIMNNVEQNPPMKREFPVNKTVTINDDGSKTIKYVYDDNGTNITDLRTIKENPDGSFIVTDENETISGQRIKEQMMYKQNSDGTITKTVFRDDGKPGLAQTLDSEGRVISESEFRLGMNTGKEIEIRRNYFADGSIEKVAFVDGERFDDFDDGEMSKPGELQFRFVKDSPMKIVDSKMPAEADLLKAGFKKDDSVMTMNGGAIYYNEQTGESFVLDEFSKTCEYRKGNITQKHSYDSDGNLTYGTIEVKGENGAFETYTYQQNEDYKELTVTSENSHDAPTTPEAFAADSYEGHWRNIDAFRDELNLPDGFNGLMFDIKEGTQEKLSQDGTCKIKVTVNPDGNLSVEYSQKQADGSFKELGKYQLTKYDSPGSLRGYDFMFEAFNNLTGNKRTISGGDWSGDY